MKRRRSLRVLRLSSSSWWLSMRRRILFCSIIGSIPKFASVEIGAEKCKMRNVSDFIALSYYFGRDDFWISTGLGGEELILMFFRGRKSRLVQMALVDLDKKLPYSFGTRYKKMIILFGSVNVFIRLHCRIQWGGGRYSSEGPKFL